eukprot:3512785-Pyramimonas_sp.AAC.1
MRPVRRLPRCRPGRRNLARQVLAAPERQLAVQLGEKPRTFQRGAGRERLGRPQKLSGELAPQGKGFRGRVPMLGRAYQGG